MPAITLYLNDQQFILYSQVKLDPSIKVSHLLQLALEGWARDGREKHPTEMMIEIRQEQFEILEAQLKAEKEAIDRLQEKLPLQLAQERHAQNQIGREGLARIRSLHSALWIGGTWPTSQGKRPDEAEALEEYRTLLRKCRSSDLDPMAEMIAFTTSASDRSRRDADVENNMGHTCLIEGCTEPASSITWDDFGSRCEECGELHYEQMKAQSIKRPWLVPLTSFTEPIEGIISEAKNKQTNQHTLPLLAAQINQHRTVRVGMGDQAVRDEAEANGWTTMMVRSLRNLNRALSDQKAIHLAHEGDPKHVVYPKDMIKPCPWQAVNPDTIPNRIDQVVIEKRLKLSEDIEAAFPDRTLTHREQLLLDMENGTFEAKPCDGPNAKPPGSDTVLTIQVE